MATLFGLFKICKHKKYKKYFQLFIYLISKKCPQLFEILSIQYDFLSNFTFSKIVRIVLILSHKKYFLQLSICMNTFFCL